MASSTDRIRRQRGNSAVEWLLSAAEPCLLAAAVFYLLYQFFLSHVEGDQAYLLYAAQQVLAGVQLDGPRLIETNPPLIVWFSEIPAGLARLLHFDPVLALRLVVLAMLAGSAAWGARILRVARVAQVSGVQATRLLWALTFFLILITQPAEFGQREQLLLVLFMPYLLAVGSGAVLELALTERIALGLCAGLAVCFKPQHLLTIVCLELFVAVYQRSLRRLVSPELLAAIAAGLLYVVAVLVVTPAYTTDILPLLQSTYWALGQFTFAAMALHVGLSLTLVGAVMTGFWIICRKRFVLPQMQGALLASAAGATLAYFVQHTGWYHQRFTAIALFEITAVWMAVDLLSRSRPAMLNILPASRPVWIGLSISGLLAFGGAEFRAHRAVRNTNDMTYELARYPPGTTVYAFTVSMSAFPVVLDHRLMWGSRFAHLWMMPAIRANEAPAPDVPHNFKALPPARVAELASLQRRDTAEDLQRTRPEVIFVERCGAPQTCESYTSGFDAVSWFSSDAAFARVWSKYAFAKTLDGFDEYVRKPAP